jgi:hypothetical protein
MILSNVLSMNARAPNGDIADRLGCDLSGGEPAGIGFGISESHEASVD